MPTPDWHARLEQVRLAAWQRGLALGLTTGLLVGAAITLDAIWSLR